MKYIVNDNCIGCGLCTVSCPGVFEMTEDGTARAVEYDVPEEALDLAAEAKDACPVSAIEESEE